MKIIFYSLVMLSLLPASSGAQVTQLSNNEGLQLLGILGPGKAIFASKKTSRLWVTNASVAGTVSYTSKVLCPTQGPTAILNGKLYFPGNTAANGTELWVTDGTDAGTQLVKDINPGTGSSDPTERFIVLNNQLFFTANNPTYGRELWKSNGTPAGTVLLKDIVPGTTGCSNDSFDESLVVGNLLFFNAITPAGGEELWRSDGTEAGTFQVKDINPGPTGSFPNIQENLGNKIIFVASNGTQEKEPWISDGTEAGTFMLKDIAPGPLSSSPDNFIVFKNKIFFSASDFVNGKELWISDGTTAGTQLLKDIEPGMMGSSPILFNGIATANKYFFTCYTSANGFEMWETDGTAGGTKLFLDLEAGADDSYPIFMPSYDNNYANPDYHPLFQGNKFFFSAFTLDKGRELYVSDGTAGGTTLIKNLDNDINDGVSGFFYYISGNAIYFCGSDGTHNAELFKSNGTAGNATPVGKINNTGGPADVKPFVIINGFLLFLGDNGDDSSMADPDLYRVDGTDNVLPVELLAFNGQAQTLANLLSWETGTAVNFSHFILERSFDGNSFDNIAHVDYNSNHLAYQYADDNLKEGSRTYYYRLKLVNQDGTSTYSRVVKLNRTSSTQVSLAAYKVSADQIAVIYTSEQPEAQIRLTDASGRTLFVKPVKGSSGKLVIPVPATAEQILFVSLQSGGQVITKKIF